MLEGGRDLPGGGPGSVVAIGAVGVSATPFLSVSEAFGCT